MKKTSIPEGMVIKLKAISVENDSHKIKLMTIHNSTKLLLQIK